MRRAVGVDVGGTKCLAVVVEIAESADASAPVITVVHEERAATPRGGGRRLVETIARLVRPLPHHDALGIGLPGLVDRHGVLWAAPNLDVDEPYAIGADVADALHHTSALAVDNDATCATVAEWHMGAGLSARGGDRAPVGDMVLVTLGTGIGGGVVAGGRLQRGHNGFAGEIGHMVVDPGGPECPCGRRGCWERYSSGSGLAHLAGGRRGEQVVADARDGDGAAQAVIAEFGRWTGIGLANLTNLLDPEVLVIGGGLVSSADVLMPAIRSGFAEALYAPDRRPHPDLRVAELGERSGAIGAALLAAGLA